MDIVHKYVVGKILACSIAREYKISPQYVSALVKKSERNNNYFDEVLQQRNDAKELKKTLIVAIGGYLKKGDYLGSVEEIRKKLEEDHDL